MTNSVMMLAFWVIFLFAPQDKTPEVSSAFQLQGEAVLTIVNETKDSVACSLENFSMVPLRVKEIALLLAPGESEAIPLRMQGVNEYSVGLSQQNLRIVSYPGSEQTIRLGGSAGALQITFEGDAVAVNKYLERRTGKFGRADALTFHRAMATQSASSVPALFQQNDSLHHASLLFLENESAGLPGWYVRFERKRLEYLNEGFKMNSVFYRRALLGRQDILPGEYLTELAARLPVNDPAMLGNVRYMLFLKDFIGANVSREIADLKPDSEEIREERNHAFDSVALSWLEGEVRDVFLTHTFAYRAQSESGQLPADWTTLIEEDSLKEVVRQEVERERLPAGTGMPYFYLENAAGEYVEPHSWRGKVVLINFWATWCKPCLKEFPHENKLVDEYAGQPVQIVNICMDSERETWERYSHKFGLKMINLFANKTWSQNLKKKFFIQTLPHSVLVGADGRILKNQAPRASGGVHRLIEDALEER